MEEGRESGFYTKKSTEKVNQRKIYNEHGTWKNCNGHQIYNYKPKMKEEEK